MAKLCQILAVADGRKKSVHKEVTAIYQQLQKPAGFNGLVKTYKPMDEKDPGQPPERKPIQSYAKKMLGDVAAALTSLFDVVATQDTANCDAKADVIVDGRPILEGVPVTHLLFLEKQLNDIASIVNHIPILDTAYEWTYDTNKGCYVTEPQEQFRTSKEQDAVKIFEPTEHQPGQYEILTKDVIVGKYNTTYLSGAMPSDEKKNIMYRVVKLQEAVKTAREEANTMAVKDVSEGEKIFEYLFNLDN
jgi:hypothetical protein